MDKAKQVAAGSSSPSSSSSFAVELFGPKDSTKYPSSSSKGLFGTIFDPPPSAMAPRRDGIGYDYTNPTHGTATDYNNRNQKEQNKYGSENRKVEPCYFNSSIYYGGQEVYSPPTHNSSPPTRNQLKKDGGEVDPNDGSSNCASRGNWWQGSLYY